MSDVDCSVCDLFGTGSVTAYGGRSGVECGGAGTILYKDTTNDTNYLIADNDNRCEPLNSRIDFASLDDLNRGADSSRTYIFDVDGSHNHRFEEV